MTVSVTYYKVKFFSGNTFWYRQRGAFFEKLNIKNKWKLSKYGNFDCLKAKTMMKMYQELSQVQYDNYDKYQLAEKLMR